MILYHVVLYKTYCQNVVLNSYIVYPVITGDTIFLPKWSIRQLVAVNPFCNLTLFIHSHVMTLTHAHNDIFTF